MCYGKSIAVNSRREGCSIFYVTCYGCAFFISCPTCEGIGVLCSCFLCRFGFGKFNYCAVRKAFRAKYATIFILEGYGIAVYVIREGCDKLYVSSYGHTCGISVPTCEGVGILCGCTLCRFSFGKSNYSAVIKGFGANNVIAILEGYDVLVDCPARSICAKYNVFIYSNSCFKVFIKSDYATICKSNKSCVLSVCSLDGIFYGNYATVFNA